MGGDRGGQGRGGVTVECLSHCSQWLLFTAVASIPLTALTGFTVSHLHTVRCFPLLMRGGGIGMTPGCVAVCSWRPLLASHYLPLTFP